MKMAEHVPCGYSMLKIWGFDLIGKKKHTLHCGKDCMKRFCTSLRKEKDVTDNKRRAKITPSC